MNEIEEVADLTLDGRPLGVINQSGLSTQSIIREGATMREIASTLSRWVDNARNASSRSSMFDRGTFTPPDNPYDEMRSAKAAMRYDSVVSGVAETTEALAFKGIKWEASNPDDADVFNQLARDQNLDSVIRSMWREEFACGQFVCAKMWDWKTYTVRGKTKKGNQRKKTYRVWAPTHLRILDSTKVVPVGHGPLGGSLLAWHATADEVDFFTAVDRGEKIDPLMTAFFRGMYTPDIDESRELAALGINPSRLMLMAPDWVFRHTLTKGDYERFADVRLKSCFRLLDLKNQLMQSDRASLIGSANYILLIRKGSKEQPGTQQEVDNLKENYNFIAKMPVIIADHRLEIDIIAPKQDFVLQSEKYDMIDSRILARLLGTLSLGGKGQRNETQETLSALVGRVMENRRHMIKRTIETDIAHEIVEHPRNEGVFESEPNLVYTPANISVDFNSAYIQGLQALRMSREMSRDTILEYFGLDQATEAQRMELEEELYDDIFKTAIPFNGQPPPPGGGPAPAPGGKPPAGEPPSVSGRRGGRPVGGGTPRKSPAAQAKPKTPAGNVSTKAAQEEDVDDGD